MTWTRPHTMTARCPEDLLAMVPVTLGFTPTDSVAMLTFGADHPFHARVDLPTHRDDLPDLANALLDPALRNGVRRVVLVLFTDDEVAARRAWHALRDAFGGAGIGVLEALRADGRRWFPLLHGDRRARDLGVPYDVSNHPFVAEAVLRGQVLRTSRDELVRSLAPLPDRVARVRSALGRRPARVGRPPTTAELLSEGAWVQSLLRRHGAGRTSPGDDDVAGLLRALGEPGLRAAALCLITRGTATDWVELWADVLRRTPTELAAPPASLLGWSAWQAGHGALAWCAVEVALRADPDDVLCDQLSRRLDQAVPPGDWEPDPDWAAGLVPRAG
ncbi:MAG: DUF4192 domain-containing protein [Nocardioides sp.]|nr:DUF4192 domain-containing protein [Nocardioides sp.]